MWGFAPEKCRSSSRTSSCRNAKGKRDMLCNKKGV